MPASRRLAYDQSSAASDATVIELIALDDEEGYEVRGAGCVGYVYPDMRGGWRPWSYYGQCLNSGYPAYRTPLAAAYFS